MNKLEKVISLIGKYICLYLSLLVPKKKKLILFGSWFGEKYDDNSKYLYEYVIRERKDLKAVWITTNRNVYAELKKSGLPVCLDTSLQAVKYALQARYICMSTGMNDIGKNYKYTGNAYWINLWHGVPLKKVMYDDEYSAMQKKSIKNVVKKLIEAIPYRHQYLVSTSVTISEIYKSAFRVDESHILQLGQPRNDYFYMEHENPYKKRFEAKKIVLYMPTHRNEGREKFDVEQILNLEHLNVVCENNNVVFLIKKHFYHSGEKDVDKRYSSIIEITNEVTESQVLLDAADILITDYSSCYIDYLLLNRPIIFYNYDIENYKKKDRQMYFEYDTVTPGKKCKSYVELATELENLLVGRDGYADERQKIGDLFYDKKAQREVSADIINSILKL